jgi:hypothetical protein
VDNDQLNACIQLDYDAFGPESVASLNVELLSAVIFGQAKFSIQSSIDIWGEIVRPSVDMVISQFGSFATQPLLEIESLSMKFEILHLNGPTASSTSCHGFSTRTL